MTDRQIVRVWECINSLQAFLAESIQKGAKGVGKHYDKAERCKKLLIKERNKIKSK